MPGSMGHKACRIPQWCSQSSPLSVQPPTFLYEEQCISKPAQNQTNTYPSY